MAQYRLTRLEIDLDVIARNARYLRAKTPAQAKMMAVVKADAYGHGAVEVSRAALPNGADALAVAIPEEGVALREAGIEAPILVLGGVNAAGAEADVQFGLTQTVYDERTVENLQSAARRLGKTAAAHLKIDSGMGRIGVRTEDEARRVLAAIEAAPRVRLTGAFTHFATADESGGEAFEREQHERFMALAGPVKAAHPEILLHCANSAAMLRAPQYAHDMVRAGVALYGNPRFPGGEGEGLSEAMRWTTEAAYVKTVAPGETIGYGRAFTAQRPTRVMTVEVGYADGYPRRMGNRAYALVRGWRAPVIGRVCMDQAMLDVTEIPDARAGDEVVLLGAQGAQKITIRQLAEWMDVIDYEAMLAPSGRVPRVYMKQGD